MSMPSNFYPICTLSMQEVNSLKERLILVKRLKPIILLTSEGSLTRAVEYLTGNKVYITKLARSNFQTGCEHRKIRCIWMETSLYTRLVFARSLWITLFNYNFKKTIKDNTPIGETFINQRTDIDKNIHELYYGYYSTSQNQSQINKPLWGRKYTLYYKSSYYITIQEFLLPELTNYLIR